MSTAIGATGAAVEEPAGRTVDRDGEQSRARYPDEEGFAERDGQRGICRAAVGHGARQ